MKNLYFLLAAAALTAFTGCTKDQDLDAKNGGSGNKGVEVVFHATADSETRADIIIGDSKFTGAWEDADAMGVFATSPDNTTPTLAPFTYSNADGGFKGTLHSTAHGDWEYVAFYPHAAAAAINEVKVPFSSTRVQDGNTYNSLYDVLLSGKIVCADADPGKTSDGQEVLFKMKRFTSILYLAMTTTELDASKKVKLVRLTADKNIAAETLDIDCTDPATATAALDAATAAKSIVVSYKEGAEPSVTDCKAFFNLLPDTYATLTFEVQTTDGLISTFTLTNKTFEAGQLYASKDRQLTNWVAAAAPASAWDGHDFSQRYELVQNLPVKVAVNCPAGIQKFEIDITSAALTELLPAVGLAEHMDLVNPATPEMASMLKTLGFPVGDQVRNFSSLTLDITSLMGMLYIVCDAKEPPVTSDNDFKLTVTDNAGQAVNNTVKLKFVTRQLRYANDADLWKNTGSFSVKPFDPLTPIGDVVVEYKRSTETTWQQATVTDGEFSGTYTASAAPAWTASTNAAGLAVNNIDRNTGIFANATYDVRLSLKGTLAETISFTTASGDIFPDGDMANTALPCFTLNSSSSAFWASGSFDGGTFVGKYQLCKPETFDGHSTAHLAPATVWGVLAAGSLSIGTFKYASMTGTASFGQPYSYTARPTALKVKYHATVGIVDQPGNSHPNQIPKDSPDKSRIFIGIIDWDSRHAVAAGVSSVNGAWDLETQSSVAEGNIIGYGSLWITESTTEAGLVEAIIPIYYYDNVTKPSKAYSLCLSAATSAYGDYKNGSTKSDMYITDFEWVY